MRLPGMMKEYEIRVLSGAQWVCHDTYESVVDALKAAHELGRACRVCMFSGRVLHQIGEPDYNAAVAAARAEDAARGDADGGDGTHWKCGRRCNGSCGTVGRS